MALKNVRRVTFSLPKVTLKKLEIAVPKNKRSKFIAEIIEKKLSNQQNITDNQTEKFWKDLAKKYPDKISNKKTAVELVREDRASH